MSGFLPVQPVADQDLPGVEYEKYMYGQFSLGSTLEAEWERTVESNPVNSINRMIEQQGAKEQAYKQPELDIYSIEKANEQGKDLGLRFDKPVLKAEYDLIAERKKKERERELILNQSKQDFVTGAATFGTSLLASLYDPINIGVGFIPFVGEWKLAGAAGKAAFGGALARGAVEGAVGNLVLEPLPLMASSMDQANYTIMDSAMNVTVGAIFGGAMGGAGYAINSVFSGRLGRVPSKEAFENMAIAKTEILNDTFPVVAIEAAKATPEIKMSSFATQDIMDMTHKAKPELIDGQYVVRFTDDTGEMGTLEYKADTPEEAVKGLQRIYALQFNDKVALAHLAETPTGKLSPADKVALREVDFVLKNDLDTVLAKYSKEGLITKTQVMAKLEREEMKRKLGKDVLEKDQEIFLELSDELQSINEARKEDLIKKYNVATAKEARDIVELKLDALWEERKAKLDLDDAEKLDALLDQRIREATLDNRIKSERLKNQVMPERKATINRLKKEKAALEKSILETQNLDSKKAKQKQVDKLEQDIRLLEWEPTPINKTVDDLNSAVNQSKSMDNHLFYKKSDLDLKEQYLKDKQGEKDPTTFEEAEMAEFVESMSIASRDKAEALGLTEEQLAKLDSIEGTSTTLTRLAEEEIAEAKELTDILNRFINCEMPGGM